MNEAIDQLARSLVDKTSLSECSIEELQNLSVQYPFFGPVHFLLSQRLKKADPAAFEKQIQKTSLFFQNSLWLQYLNDNYVIPDTIQPVETGETFRETPQVYEVSPEEKVDDTIAPEEPGSEPANTVTDPEKVIEQAELMAEPDIEQEEQITDHHESVSETVNTGMAEDQADSEPGQMENEFVTAPVEQVIEPVIDNQISEQSEIIADSEVPVEATGEMIEEEWEMDESGEPGIEESETKVKLPPLKIGSVDTASSTLAFEPYHTIDYFASQGVSLSEGEKNKDKFGQQLKSFTEWLKTMKRLPESEIIAPAVVQQDPKVERMAEHSVAAGEVITETMAEVWEKQGNHAKAIEIYDKLSLLNPGKSSYFAAKIEHLKHS